MSGLKPWEQNWGGQNMAAVQISDKKPWEQDWSGNQNAGQSGTQAATKPKSDGSAMRDLGLSVAKGAADLPSAGVAIADMASQWLGLNDDGNASRKYFTGGGNHLLTHTEKASEKLANARSDEFKADNQAVHDAKGLWNTTKAVLANPINTIGGTVAESLPSMAVSGLVGGAAKMALARGGLSAAKAGVVGGAIGEGTIGAGQMAAQIQQETGGLTGEQAGLSALSGAMTGGLGALGGKVAQKLGVADVDSAMASGSLKALGDTAEKSVVKAGLKGAISEGLLEELPQSVSEQILQNVAMGKHWAEDLDTAAVLGTFAGAAMGGGMAGTSAAVPKAGELLQQYQEKRLENAAQGQQDTQEQTAALDTEAVLQQEAAQEQEQVQTQAQDVSSGVNSEVSPQDGAMKQVADNSGSLNAETATSVLPETIQNDAITANPETETVPVAPKLSEQMGLDANVGALSAAAVQAVDSGAANMSAARDVGAQNQAASATQTANGADATNEVAASSGSGSLNHAAKVAQNQQQADGSRPADSLAATASADLVRVQNMPVEMRRQDGVVNEALSSGVLPPIQNVLHRAENYKMPAAMAKSPDRLGLLLDNKSVNGQPSMRQRFKQMPERVQKAFEIVADYQADRTLRDESGEPPMLAHYPPVFQAALSEARRFIQAQPEYADVWQRLSAAATGYRRNAGWVNPLASKAVDLAKTGVEPEMAKGGHREAKAVEPVAKGVEPLAAETNMSGSVSGTPVNMSGSVSDNILNNISDTTMLPESRQTDALPEWVDVQTIDGKTKRVSRADWDNGDVKNLTVYSANGKKTAVKLLREKVVVSVEQSSNGQESVKQNDDIQALGGLNEMDSVLQDTEPKQDDGKDSRDVAVDSRVSENSGSLNVAEPSQKQIDEFIDNALSQNDPRGELPLWEVSAREVDLIKQQADLDVSGLWHVLDAQALKHILKRHGKNEEVGQREITSDDLKRIPEILRNFDSIKVQKRTANKSSVIYQKKLQDGSIEFVERVIETSANKNPRLLTKTMWIKQAATGVKSSLPQVSTPDRLVDNHTPKQVDVQGSGSLKSDGSFHADKQEQTVLSEEQAQQMLDLLDRQTVEQIYADLLQYEAFSNADLQDGRDMLAMALGLDKRIALSRAFRIFEKGLMRSENAQAFFERQKQDVISKANQSVRQLRLDEGARIGKLVSGNNIYQDVVLKDYQGIRKNGTVNLIGRMGKKRKLREFSMRYDALLHAYQNGGVVPSALRIDKPIDEVIADIRGKYGSLKSDADIRLDAAIAQLQTPDNVAKLVVLTHQLVRDAVGDEHMSRVNVVSRVDALKHFVATKNYDLNKSLRDAQNARGWFDNRTGKVFLVAENFERPELAAFTAWHELGHAKVALSGRKEWRAVLADAYERNALVRAVTDMKMAEKHGKYRNRDVAMEEAIVEMFAALKTGNHAEFKSRYGVNFPIVPTRHFLQRVLTALRHVVNRVLGKQVALSDEQLIGLLGKLDDVDLNVGKDLGSLKTETRFDLNETVSYGIRKGLLGLSPVPITRLSGNEFGVSVNFKNTKIMADKLLRLLQAAPLGTLHNDDMGWDLRVSKDDRKKMGNNRYLLHETSQAVAGIQDLVKHAVLVETHKDTQHGNERVKAVHRLYAPVEIAGKLFRVKLTVKDYVLNDGGKQKNLHAIETAEIENAPMGTVPPDVSMKQEAAQPTSGLTLSIADLLRGATDNLGNEIVLGSLNDDVRFDVADVDTPQQRNLAMNKLIDAVSFSGSLKDLKQSAGDKWTDVLKVGLQFLGRRQLVGVYGKLLPQLQAYDDLVDKFGADGNKTAMKADDLVIRWGKLQEREALADLMHEATIAQVDADSLKKSDVIRERSEAEAWLTEVDARLEAAQQQAGEQVDSVELERRRRDWEAKRGALEVLEKRLADAENESGDSAMSANVTDVALKQAFVDAERLRVEMQRAENAYTALRDKAERAEDNIKSLKKQQAKAEERYNKAVVAAEKLADLNKRFDALSDDAKAVYRQARDDYKQQFEQIQAAMKARLERMGVRSKGVFDDLDEKFAQGLKGVYFPLSRFGQYVVVVRDADGKPISVSRAETMKEARQLHADLLKQFPDDTVEKPVLSKEFAQSRDGVGRGFLQKLRKELDNHLGFNSEQFAYIEDVLMQLHFQSMPDLSWAKHGIHRKNRAGFSNDARRAYAQSMSSGASYLAKLRYGDLLQAELDNMQAHADSLKNTDKQPVAQRVVDEMVKRHDNMMNPKPNALSTGLTSFGFLWYLGLSPASAIVNLSQTVLVAYPVMAAKWGYDKAGKELLKASLQVVNKDKSGKKHWNDISGSLNDDELVAYNRAVDDGTIDISQAHDLAGVASGEDSGTMWRFRGVMRGASWLFHQAERFNRQVTFVAAYRLAKQAGADSDVAFEQAKKATYDGHFDYATHNRPRFMQGNVARVVFLFKQYSQNMIYTLARGAYQTLKGDKEARRMMAGLLTMHAAAAGVLGLPMVTTLLAAASWLGSDDDEPWDAEVAMRNLLAEIFGDKGGEIIAKGLSRATPWDISGRVGLDKLIFPDVQEGLEGKRWAESFAAGLAGPIVGLGINWANGGQKLSQGDYGQALEAFMPVAVRNPLKSLRLGMDGMKDSSGIMIKDDFNAWELGGQFIGFSASDARLAQESKSAIYQADRRLQARRSELLAMFAKAQMAGDMDKVREVREHIVQFNSKNPSRKITVPQMLQSVRNRQKRIDEAKDGIYLSKNRQDARAAGAFGTES
ncbi:PLxRFG domain-containing protein [Wielerella bovis]|uniref:PLxRFG domain-containing protein n=1 Tax=Wielerella bovis TaxID=2917790 RepID=UPI002018E848|nr:PLxRFG domain-containing protein [Wielerella bovis]ULJ66677.1 PLxRFG domain-containing protein [Wielerella bovis]